MAEILSIENKGYPKGPGTLYSDGMNENFFIEIEANTLVNLKTGETLPISGIFKKKLADMNIDIFFGELTLTNG